MVDPRLVSAPPHKYPALKASTCLESAVRRRAPACPVQQEHTPATLQAIYLQRRPILATRTESNRVVWQAEWLSYHLFRGKSD